MTLPSAHPYFKLVNLPREFVDPSNYRLHPKGGQSNIQHFAMITPTPSPSPEIKQERYVTVHRIGQAQSLRISLSNQFKVFFYFYIGFLSDYYSCI